MTNSLKGHPSLNPPLISPHKGSCKNNQGTQDKKSYPGYDLITFVLLKGLSRRKEKHLNILFNAIIRLIYFPKQWKVSKIITCPKPGKSPNDVKSYHIISLLPVISKVLGKILCVKLKPIFTKRNLFPDHQFGFRTEHSTVEQVHRVIDKIVITKKKEYCSTQIFLDTDILASHANNVEAFAKMQVQMQYING